MDQSKLAYFKQRLLDLHQNIEDEISHLMEATAAINEDASMGIGNHLADGATDIYEREKNLALIDDRRLILSQITDALERIEQGTYGICQKTGKPIALERLEVIPYAAYSVEAQAALEQLS